MYEVLEVWKSYGVFYDLEYRVGDGRILRDKVEER